MCHERVASSVWLHEYSTCNAYNGCDSSRALELLRDFWQDVEGARDAGGMPAAALTLLERELKLVTCWCLQGQ